MVRTVRLAAATELAEGVAALGLDPPGAVLVVVGGAESLSPTDVDAATNLFTAAVIPLCTELGAVVLDGGTDAGVMQATGRARRDADASFPLVGVVAEGTIAPVGLEPNHTHFVVVPGDDWGDESAWLAPVALAIASGAPVAALLVGGGEVSRRDVTNLTAAGLTVVVVPGIGGLADELALGHLATTDRDAPPGSALVLVNDAIEEPSSLQRALRAAWAR